MVGRDRSSGQSIKAELTIALILNVHALKWKVDRAFARFAHLSHNKTASEMGHPDFRCRLLALPQTCFIAASLPYAR